MHVARDCVGSSLWVPTARSALPFYANIEMSTHCIALSPTSRMSAATNKRWQYLDRAADVPLTSPSIDQESTAQMCIWRTNLDNFSKEASLSDVIEKVEVKLPGSQIQGLSRNKSALFMTIHGPSMSYWGKDFLILRYNY